MERFGRMVLPVFAINTAVHHVRDRPPAAAACCQLGTEPYLERLTTPTEMKILDIKAMRGPNQWSITRQKLIVMRLDIEDLEQKPTDKIPGFFVRMKELLPSLYGHRCSEDHEGGFFERVERGTW